MEKHAQMMKVCVRWTGVWSVCAGPGRRNFTRTMGGETHERLSLSQDGARVVLVFLESFVQRMRCARNAYHGNIAVHTESVVVHHTRGLHTMELLEQAI